MNKPKAAFGLFIAKSKDEFRKCQSFFKIRREMKILPTLLTLGSCANTSKKPNIIFILTDDQGYSDVSWHNRHVKSPNLDLLRKEGLTIEGGYSQPGIILNIWFEGL